MNARRPASSGRAALAWAAVCLLGIPAAARAPAEAFEAGRQDFQITAEVDRTTLDIGGQLTLTITLEGNLAAASLQPVELPPGFVIIAQSRSSNVSVHPTGIKRAMSLTYVVTAERAGTFQLGPFTAVRKDGRPKADDEQAVSTEPIDITVRRPVLPPGSGRHERLTL